MNEPYDTLAECSIKVGLAFDREKDRYVDLQMTNIALTKSLQALYDAVDSCVELTPEVMVKARAALDLSKIT